MIHTKNFLIISLLIFCCLTNTALLVSQENQENNFNYDQIHQEIGYIHKNIRQLTTQYKDKIIDNKLRVSIGLGLHNILDDNEKYVYRNDAFFYFSDKNNLQSMKLIYEQTRLGSLSTEVRIIELMNLSEVAPFPIKIKYISWTLNQENGDKETSMNLVRFSDKIIAPPGATSIQYAIDNLQTSEEKFNLLLTYRKIIKKLESTMLLSIESDKQNKKKVRRRSLHLGRKSR